MKVTSQVKSAVSFTATKKQTQVHKDQKSTKDKKITPISINASKKVSEEMTIKSQMEKLNSSNQMFKKFAEEMDLSNIVTDKDKGEYQQIKKMFNEVEALDSAGNFKAGDKIWDKLISKLDALTDAKEFKDFSEELDLKSIGLSKEELANLENQFKQVNKLEREGKFEESDKIWDKLMDKIESQTLKHDLKTFSNDLKKDFPLIPKSSLKEIEDLFMKVGVHDYKGEHKEGDKLWGKMTSIIDKYAEKITS